jgi:hypothetical protein
MRRQTLVHAAVVTVLAVGVVTASAGEARAEVRGLTDCRFSSAQVFDVQWTLTDGMLTVSDLALPHASFEPRFGALRPSEVADTDLFVFAATGPDGVPDVALRQLAADGSLIRTLHLAGSFRAVGPGFILYLGNGFRPTLITTMERYELGSSVTLPVSVENLTIAQALGFTACSATPVGAEATGQNTGQNAVPAPVPGTIPTGGGPMPLVPLPLGATLAALIAVVLVIEQQRARAWIAALAARPRTSRRGRGGTAERRFDLLQVRLDLLRDGLR